MEPRRSHWRGLVVGLSAPVAAREVLEFLLPLGTRMPIRQIRGAPEMKQPSVPVLVPLVLVMACVGMASSVMAGKPPPPPSTPNPQIVFERYLTGAAGSAGSTTGIFVMDDDGAHVTRLTTNLTSRDAWPRWSPDGKRIAFFHGGLKGDTTQGVYVLDNVRVEGGAVMADGPRQLLLGASRPVWSPGGDSLVASLDGDLVLINAVDGTVIRDITQTSEIFEFACDYKEDPATEKYWLLLVEQYGQSYGWEPAVIDMGTGTTTRLLTGLPGWFIDGGGEERPGAYKVESARFSPDLTCIAYSVSYENGYHGDLGAFGWQLHLADLDLTRLPVASLADTRPSVVLSSVMLSANGGSASFRPDGDSFVFMLYRSAKVARRYYGYKDISSMWFADGPVTSITGMTTPDEIEPDCRPAP